MPSEIQSPGYDKFAQVAGLTMGLPLLLASDKLIKYFNREPGALFSN